MDTWLDRAGSDAPAAFLDLPSPSIPLPLLRHALRAPALPVPVPVLPTWRPRPSEQDRREIARLTDETLTLLMAGGRGSRLGPLSAQRAKPAVPFGGKFRIVDFALSNCFNSGLRRVGVLLQYEGRSLIRHIQQGWSFCRGRFGECVELLPAQQGASGGGWYAGTADAIWQNADFIRAHRPRYVLVLAGDHIYRMDYGPMIARHVASGARLTVGCVEVPQAQAGEFGVMTVDHQSRITAFREKPAPATVTPDANGNVLASMGIYVFDTDYLLAQLERDAAREDSAHDFGHNVVPAAIGRVPVLAYAFRDLRDGSRPGYWRDVGTLDAYWRTSLELTQAGADFDLYDMQWPVWTSETQEPPARLSDSAGRRGRAIDTLLSGGCLVTGATVKRSVLSVRASVDAGSRVEDSVLLPGAQVGRRCRLRRVILDEDCRVPEGCVIGYDPVADAQRFHVTAGGVVVVTADMLAGA